MEKTKELLKNTIVFGLGTFGSKAIQFILVPLYTVYLTTEEYGIGDLIVSTVSMILPFLTMGLSSAVLRFLINQYQNRGKVLKAVLGICVAAAFILAFFVPVFSRIEAFGKFGYMIPILFACYSIQSMIAEYCKGIEKNIIYAIDGIISAITLSVFSIIFIAKLDTGIGGYLWAICISKIISIIFLFINCRIYEVLFYKEKIEMNLLKEMLQYSLPLIPNEMSWWIIQMSDRYMVTYFHGAALNGLYSMAYKIPAIFNLIVSIFIKAFGITAIKQCDDSEQAESKIDGKYFGAIYKKYISISFLAVSIIILCTRPFAYIFLKNEFYESWKFTPLLLCSFVVGNLQAFYGSIFSGIKKTKVLFVSTLLGAIVNVLLNLCLIPNFHAIGAASATVVSYVVVYVVRMKTIKKYVDMEHYEAKCILLIILSVLMSIFYIIDKNVGDIFSGIIAVVIWWILKNEVSEMWCLGKKFWGRIFKRNT